MTKESALLADNPFANYVSRPEIKETIFLDRPVVDALDALSRAIDSTKKSTLPRLVPILGDAGFGKTHLFHSIVQRNNNGQQSNPKHKKSYLTYVTPPTDAEKTFSHLYFSIIKSHGVNLLEEVANELHEKYNGSIEDAYIENPGPSALVIEAFFALMDDNRKRAALRWLTGMKSKDLDIEETIVANEALALASLGMMSKFAKKPFVLFVDEMEGLYLSSGKDAELKFLENLKRIYNECRNVVIVLAALTSLYDKALEFSSPAVLQRIDPPVLLKRFSKTDIRDYSQQALYNMWKRHGQLARSSEIWPLTDGDIDSAYAYSHGNPREALKWLKFRLEEKKLDILKEVAENHNITKKNVEKARKIINEVREDFENLSLGVFSQGSGAFILLAQDEIKFLFAIPPAPEEERESFFTNLEETQQQGNYKKIYCFNGEEDLPKNIKDLSLKAPDKTVRQITRAMRKILKEKD